jgi:hypothetical protein
MRRYDLPDLVRSRCTGIDCSFHGADIALHNDGYEATSRLLLCHYPDVGRLHHSVSSLNGSH